MGLQILTMEWALPPDIEAISSFEALWCNLGAQEETNQFIQTQLQQYITLGPAFAGRAASTYGTLVAANSISQNLANQSAGISAPVVNGLGQTNGCLAMNSRFPAPIFATPLTSISTTPQLGFKSTRPRASQPLCQRAQTRLTFALLAGWRESDKCQ